MEKSNKESHSTQTRKKMKTLKLLITALFAAFLSSCAFNSAPQGVAMVNIGNGSSVVPGVAGMLPTGHYVRSPFLSSLGRPYDRRYPCGTPACLPRRNSCGPMPPPRRVVYPQRRIVSQACPPPRRIYARGGQGRGLLGAAAYEVNRGTGGRGLLGAASYEINRGTGGLGLLGAIPAKINGY